MSEQSSEAAAITAEVRGILAIRNVSRSEVAKIRGKSRASLDRALADPPQTQLDLEDLAAVAEAIGESLFSLLRLLADRAQGMSAHVMATANRQAIGAVGSVTVAGDITIEQK